MQETGLIRKFYSELPITSSVLGECVSHSASVNRWKLTPLVTFFWNTTRFEGRTHTMVSWLCSIILMLPRMLRASPGNDNLNLLTSTKRYKLRIDMTQVGGSASYAEYDNFFVNSSADNYRLVSIGKYSGTAGLGFCCMRLKLRKFNNVSQLEYPIYNYYNEARKRHSFT